MKSLKKATTDIKEQVNTLAGKGFRQIFDRIDQLRVKKGVDTLGLDRFIEQCAFMAAGTGALAGTGGVFTLFIGLPVDVMNLLTQQFRVTMAVTYANKGTYKLSFEEFMAVLAESLKVEAGVTITKNVLEAVAEKILVKVGAGAARRLVPVVGAAIGGAANYIFVKRMAQSVKEMQQNNLKIN